MVSAATVAPGEPASEEKGASPHQNSSAAPPRRHKHKRKNKRLQDRRISVFQKQLLEHTLDPEKDLAAAILGAEKAARFRKWFKAHLGKFVLAWFFGKFFDFDFRFRGSLIFPFARPKTYSGICRILRPVDSSGVALFIHSFSTCGR